MIVKFINGVINLWILSTLGFDVEGVEAHAAGHEEAVFHWAAEAEIGTGFGEVDFANEVALGCKNVNAVVFGVAPAGAGPEVAVFVTPDAVGKAGFHVDKELVIFEGVILNTKDADVGRAA